MAELKATVCLQGKDIEVIFHHILNLTARQIIKEGR